MASQNFNIVIFSDTMNMMNVKLCMMVVLTELYPFTLLSMTLIVLQGHNSLTQFQCDGVEWKECVLQELNGLQSSK